MLIIALNPPPEQDCAFLLFSSGELDESAFYFQGSVDQVNSYIRSLQQTCPNDLEKLQYPYLQLQTVQWTAPISGFRTALLGQHCLCARGNSAWYKISRPVALRRNPVRDMAMRIKYRNSPRWSRLHTYEAVTEKSRIDLSKLNYLSYDILHGLHDLPIWAPWSKPADNTTIVKVDRDFYAVPSTEVRTAVPVFVLCRKLFGLAGATFDDGTCMFMRDELPYGYPLLQVGDCVITAEDIGDEKTELTARNFHELPRWKCQEGYVSRVIHSYKSTLASPYFCQVQRVCEITEARHPSMILCKQGQAYSVTVVQYPNMNKKYLMYGVTSLSELRTQLVSSPCVMRGGLLVLGCGTIIGQYAGEGYRVMVAGHVVCCNGHSNYDAGNRSVMKPLPHVSDDTVSQFNMLAVYSDELSIMTDQESTAAAPELQWFALDYSSFTFPIYVNPVTNMFLGPKGVAKPLTRFTRGGAFDEHCLMAGQHAVVIRKSALCDWEYAVLDSNDNGFQVWMRTGHLTDDCKPATIRFMRCLLADAKC